MKNETNAITVTRELRKEINAAVRARVGALPLAEVGLRGDERNLPNALKWGADSDLGDMIKLADLREIDADDRHPGCAELDLYVTTGVGMNRELETNVCILIRDGHVVGATTDGRRIHALKTSLGFPFGDWDEVAQPPQTPAEWDARLSAAEAEVEAARARRETLDAPSVVGPDCDTRDREGADEPHAADVTTDAGIDDVPHEDYPGQYVDGPDTLPTVLTLDEKVAIEIARRDRSADAWQQLPVVACRSVGCDQRFKREHAAQTICRDCMSYEPGTFTFYPIDDERAPWHARTKRSPAGAESSAPLMPTIARLTGRCANGAERDGGRVSHVVMSTRLSPTWEAALCGATPGRKSSGWQEVDGAEQPTCRRCRAHVDAEQRRARRASRGLPPALTREADAVGRTTTSQPATPSLRLRAGRELTERGAHGVKRELRTVANSPAVYWSKNHNSYVAVRNEDGTYRVLSINGIGEIRWSLDPHNDRWQCDNDGDAAIAYFFERVEGGAR